MSWISPIGHIVIFLDMYIIDYFYKVLFTNVLGMPAMLAFMVPICVFLSLRFRGINLTMLLASVRLSLSDDRHIATSREQGSTSSIGTVTSFFIQLSQNIGVGNITGAGFALYFGGPGVIFWFPIASILISVIKFSEIVLGQKYRIIDKDGSIHGGIFYAITRGLSHGKGVIGKLILCITASITALVIATTCIMSSGLQVNQLCAVLAQCGVGALMMILLICFILLIVLLGGIPRIAYCAKLTPLMAILYIACCIFIMIQNHDQLITALRKVYDGAFHLQGMLVSFAVSLQRVIFATGSGSMTASIIHANSDTRYVAREGCCAFFECFLVATILSIGAFTIVVSGVTWSDGGITVMEEAFRGIGAGGAYVLGLCTLIFCFNTVLSDGYIFQKALDFVLPRVNKAIYAFIYVMVVGFLSFHPSSVVLQLVDITTMLAMIPSVVVILLFMGPIKQEIDLYLRSLKTTKHSDVSASRS